jgi:hypothetical protein
MLFAQGVVNLVLKLNVRVHLAIAARRRVHFHIQCYRRSAEHGHCASVGFCGATYEVVLAPSFGIHREPHRVAAVVGCEKHYGLPVSSGVPNRPSGTVLEMVVIVSSTVPPLSWRIDTH